MHLPNPRGFTLIELLVVIAIIAVLSVIGVAAYRGITSNLTENKRKNDINAIAKAYESQYSKNGSYQVLGGTDFVGTKIPTPYEGGSYFIAGPNASSPTNDNFAVCASLVDNNQCLATSSSCYCVMSTQGTPVDTFSLGNPTLNGSFETDSNNDGLADNWAKHRLPNLVALAKSPAPIDGVYVQKVVVNGCCFQGIAQTITGLKPSTTYKQTAWMYLEGGHGPCTSVGVGMQGPGGETFTGCEFDKWIQLTLTGKSDTAGSYFIDFQNWTDNAFFYVDAVRLEEVSQSK